jgi:phosphoglycerate dehydrogenase-like enzyme
MIPMLTLVMMPPQNDLQRQWAPRLQRSLLDYRVMVPETEAEARHELIDADAAYGWVPPSMLPAATKLRWLQNPQAGHAPGCYYPPLIAHPVVVCNPRGIYFDHISHHILMFVLALSRGLPDYLAAQRQRRWNQQARQHPYVYLGEATALIVGVGGIGRRPPGSALRWG